MRTSTAPWYVSGVLVEAEDETVTMHPRWPTRWSDNGEAALADEWSYLADRVRSGRCGNMMSYELIGFDVSDREAVADVVCELADRLTQNGPWGRPLHLAGDPLGEESPACEPTPRLPPLWLVKT